MTLVLSFWVIHPKRDGPLVVTNVDSRTQRSRTRFDTDTETYLKLISSRSIGSTSQWSEPICLTVNTCPLQSNVCGLFWDEETVCPTRVRKHPQDQRKDKIQLSITTSNFRWLILTSTMTDDLILDLLDWEGFVTFPTDRSNFFIRWCHVLDHQVLFFHLDEDPSPPEKGTLITLNWSSRKGTCREMFQVAPRDL